MQGETEARERIQRIRQRMDAAEARLNEVVGLGLRGQVDVTSLGDVRISTDVWEDHVYNLRVARRTLIDGPIVQRVVVHNDYQDLAGKRGMLKMYHRYTDRLVFRFFFDADNPPAFIAGGGCRFVENTETRRVWACGT